MPGILIELSSDTRRVVTAIDDACVTAITARGLSSQSRRLFLVGIGHDGEFCMGESSSQVVGEMGDVPVCNLQEAFLDILSLP
ncbi:hypothetical protein JTE90_021184 [Oedothorax gibbosus]|uniref:Uncharacterized protein n=1 Tax=Oedothorax gibbosus TaxID=931172 RepID=A0AAV6V628_9ARAC|nr:hypothetical protein JTE90_021184 [Oedothorax gibbosus]